MAILEAPLGPKLSHAEQQDSGYMQIFSSPFSCAHLNDVYLWKLCARRARFIFSGEMKINRFEGKAFRLAATQSMSLIYLGA